MTNIMIILYYIILYYIILYYIILYYIILYYIIFIYGNIPHWTYKQNTIQITYFLTLQFEIMKTFKKNIKIKDMNIYTIHR
ncbi:hypothetical protein PFUGPA_05740 [Plasmodium falciparum Palo Alto/Uganda]|uniref:Uncharacterized protein n=1 Tax=Plasmodium falciparum (isolate Palo Alto / Uganda) TaxID=57270 RepID=W4IQW2_PLAFP|nr:hypothetical protein PFUGPA_05740 [Plasmodium falciparum Palo Alto/Uganda]